ncbi:hypothetical protein HN643_00500 [Candidatus Falkowbacteria bacterium]|jgi:hypothetical protein|nr:hypothetical protein [Candidatus Falkowbacteria bacterium]MBT5503335.1 hypothetical protein [Candidatus Falkowbacteria bacterium]MBT7500137.1 hypothetical protein [Candidatus Falkowbacteria bacterium]
MNLTKRAKMTTGSMNLDTLICLVIFCGVMFFFYELGTNVLLPKSWKKKLDKALKKLGGNLVNATGHGMWFVITLPFRLIGAIIQAARNRSP